MKIAQVAPLYESVPPQLYGGTERVVSYLTEELVRLGHDVILFASGDSVTKAHLIPVCPRGLRLEGKRVFDPISHHVRMMEMVFSEEADFDVLHFHIDYLHFPLVRRHNIPAVTTLHGRLDLPDLVPLFKVFPHVNVVSISDSQRKPLPWLSWVGTVLHGLPEDLYRSNEKAGDYFAFLGRVCPEKGLDKAIEIAERTGIPLKIAAKVDVVDREYHATFIKPLLKHPLIEFVGEIDQQEKNEFLGNALALLFPIDWPEPFGLVMIEAMACGTPVIAFRRGSVPEVLEHGKTGFIVDSVTEAVAVTGLLGSFDRRICRETFEKRFTARRMALDYLEIYRSLALERCQLEDGLTIAPTKVAAVLEEAPSSLKKEAGPLEAVA
jgi:glycosyltransferase involved in cell wall biosynthesis